MDPLTSLSLAANIIQCTQFLLQLFRSTKQIVAAGSSDDCQYLDSITSQLSDFHSKLSNRDHPDLSNSNQAPFVATRRQLEELAGACQIDCDKLLQLLKRFRIKDGTKKHWWQPFHKALVEIWTQSDVSRLRMRIQERQDKMVLLLCGASRYNTTLRPRCISVQVQVASADTGSLWFSTNLGKLLTIPANS